MGIANLNDAFAQLQRAEEHSRALNQQISAYGRQHANTIHADFRYEDGWHVLYVGPFPAFPERFTQMVRDCLNSVRTTLNLTVHQLLLREDKESHQAHYFPTCETLEEFLSKVEMPARQREQSPLFGLPVNGDAWTLIQQTQPFNDSQPHDCPLALLNKLTDVDEQHVLTLQVTFIRENLIKGVRWQPHMQPVEREFRNVPISPIRPTVIARFRFSTDEDPCMEVNGKLRPSPIIRYGETLADPRFLHVLVSDMKQLLEQLQTLPRVHR